MYSEIGNELCAEFHVYMHMPLCLFVGRNRGMHIPYTVKNHFVFAPHTTI